MSEQVFMVYLRKFLLQFLRMNQLISHNVSLREFLERDDSLRSYEQLKQLSDLDLIDGVLRKCLSIEDMREAGSFFTGSLLAQEAISKFFTPITSNSVVLDPTCGAGNLLIACSRNLGVENTLSQTLYKWGKVLWGYDIHSSFVEATKLRLVIEALVRGVEKDCSIDEAVCYFENIVSLDAMGVDSQSLEQVTHVIMNPPFSEWSSPRRDYWNRGKVNAAGVLFDNYLRTLPDDCQVSAILPDVLRSGSRYGGFRNFVSTTMRNVECNIWGRFNTKTDVDVFILNGFVRRDTNSIIHWHPALENYTKLSTLFDVCIGPLVAYRDPEEGTEYPYFHPKNCVTWGKIDKGEITETRKFRGRAISPPFVVVKRTSSPSDRYRAAATLINVKELAAVENHLIVIKPKSGKISDCKALMNLLKSDEINAFLNDRVRMRHLTVGVIKDIPINQM